MIPYAFHSPFWHGRGPPSEHRHIFFFDSSSLAPSQSCYPPTFPRVSSSVSYCSPFFPHQLVQTRTPRPYPPTSPKKTFSTIVKTPPSHSLQADFVDNQLPSPRPGFIANALRPTSRFVAFFRLHPKLPYLQTFLDPDSLMAFPKRPKM